MGSLKLEPALSRLDLLAAPVAKALEAWPAEAPIDGDLVMVAPIDATLADTAAFCEAYDVGLDVSANCVIVAGRGCGRARRADAVRSVRGARHHPRRRQRHSPQTVGRSQGKLRADGRRGAVDRHG